MVDEPWDGLKGEVGPVLASIAPFVAMSDEARPDVWLWLPGVALLYPVEARKAMAKGGLVRDWSETGTGLRGKCFRRRKNGTRLSTGTGFWSTTNTAVARVNGQPASVDVCFSRTARVGKPAGKPFRFARQQGLA